MKFSSKFCHKWLFVPMKHFLGVLENFNLAHFCIIKIDIVWLLCNYILTGAPKIWSKSSFCQGFAIHGHFLGFLGNFNLEHLFILKIGVIDAMLMLANDLNAIIFRWWSHLYKRRWPTGRPAGCLDWKCWRAECWKY